MGYFAQKPFIHRIKINDFRGDPTYISAKTATLVVVQNVQRVKVHSVHIHVGQEATRTAISDSVFIVKFISLGYFGPINVNIYNFFCGIHVGHEAARTAISNSVFKEEFTSLGYLGPVLLFQQKTSVRLPWKLSIIIFFKKAFRDESIQKIFNLILKTEALLGSYITCEN